MGHRRTYLVFAVLVFALEVAGQPYFSRIYNGFGLNRATITPDSGLVLCGGGSSTYFGTSLLRVDRDGTPLWTTAYSVPGEPVRIRDVTWIGDSSYILVGYAGENWTTNNKMVQQVVGPTGEVVWGGRATGTWYDDPAYRLNRAERAPDGSAVLCGTQLTMSLAGVFGPGYAVRIGEEAGTYSTPLISYGGLISVLEDVAPTSDGGFVSIGYAGNYTIAVKVSATGEVVWARRLVWNGSDQLWMHVVEGEEGATYVATQYYGATFRLIRLDPTGTVSWTKRFQMSGDDGPTGLVRFPNGDLWISGMSWLMACTSIGDVLWAHEVPHMIMDMEGVPEADGVFLIGREGSDGWLMRTDINGQAPGCTETSLVPIVTTETLVSESYSDMSPANALTAYETDVAPGAIPTTQVDCVPTAILAALDEERAMSAYPVPFTDRLYVELPFPHDRMDLIDAQGAVRCSLRTNNERSFVLPRGDLASGLYLLRVMNGSAMVGTKQLVVE